MSAVALHTAPRFALGEFRCAPDDVRWQRGNVIEPVAMAVAAFPITSVVIRHDRRDPLLANPNHVVFYRGGDRYRRALHDPRGDHCLFVDFDAGMAADLAASAGLAGGDVPFAHGPSRAREYLRLRLVAHAAASGEADALAIEEAVCDALSAAFEAAAAVHRVRDGRRPATTAEHERLVEGAKRLLTERATSSDSLSSLAKSLHVSEFHLARAFRARTGFTLHGYRTHLRLRSALERLARGHDDLGSVATELGFNSHSHFTGAFRSVFGASPSQVRATCGRRGRAELSRILEAPPVPAS